eukprot:CCRYP_013551-RB/>CCRYP_013551-RB protein AED:0.09 eAED:0.09 QI:75/-1/1/1/-1/0/1/77/749
MKASTSKKGNTGKQPSIHHSKRNASPKGKLGILLIDHGSKRQASNDALHSIADRYATVLHERWNANSSTGQAAAEESRPIVAVRASHMELATPTIESGLRSLLVREGVTNIVCVPYFLGGGRHVMRDVPTLIDDARMVLEEEGLMELSEEEGGRVEITMSRYLGSDVESILGVVNDLVGEALKENGWDETFSWISINSDNVSDGENRDADHKTHAEGKELGTKENSLQSELLKYTNRATLLENMLEKKVQQLRTMTNRVTILEDVLNKKLEENDSLRRRMKENVVDGGKHANEERGGDDDSKDLANLTSTIQALLREKEDMANQTQVLKTQTIDMANEYNRTVTELLDKISLLEGELKRQNETNAILLSKQAHQQNQTLESQQQKIDELQAQLADILDAYNELEQLQNETEMSVIKYRNQLVEAEQENERLNKNERVKEEQYQLKLNESQRLLEEERMKSQSMLDVAKDEYEKLLVHEKAAAEEWKTKWDALSAEANERMDDSAASDSRPEEEWTNMKNELEETLRALNESKSKIHELEKELKQQRDDEKSFKTSQQQQLEQQQQLQEYLQAQLQTYYETIQDQTTEISDYKKQIDEMQMKHNDSMLIATKSVEASQLRETDLLNNIEELEGELKLLQEEKKDYDMKLKTLQESLNAVEKDNDVAQAKDELDHQYKQLAMEVDKLRREVDVVTGEKNAIMTEKVKLERVLIDRVLGEDRKPEEFLVNKKTNQKKWRSYLWRPWTLLKRK